MFQDYVNILKEKAYTVLTKSSKLNSNYQNQLFRLLDGT